MNPQSQGGADFLFFYRLIESSNRSDRLPTAKDFLHPARDLSEEKEGYPFLFLKSAPLKKWGGWYYENFPCR
jgi:hypothetical protein